MINFIYVEAIYFIQRQQQSVHYSASMVLICYIQCVFYVVNHISNFWKNVTDIKYNYGTKALWMDKWIILVDKTIEDVSWTRRGNIKVSEYWLDKKVFALWYLYRLVQQGEEQSWNCTTDPYYCFRDGGREEMGFRPQSGMFSLDEPLEVNCPNLNQDEGK